MKKIIKDYKNFVNENYYSREDEEDDSHDEYNRGYDNEDEDEDEDDIEDVAELYRKFGDYSYACDAIAYYIFGEKNSDNVLSKAYKGVYGRNTEVDASEVSSYMLDYEYSWKENIEDINNFIMNLPTRDGKKLSFYY